MKNKKICIFSALLAVILCMTAFPLTAYAGGGPEWEEPIPEQVEETTGGYEPEPLTPEGNMTLVDDIEGRLPAISSLSPLLRKTATTFTSSLTEGRIERIPFIL